MSFAAFGFEVHLLQLSDDLAIDCSISCRLLGLSAIDQADGQCQSTASDGLQVPTQQVTWVSMQCVQLSGLLRLAPLEDAVLVSNLLSSNGNM